uniref:Uncharacterized protein n=1 Tax=Arundo donax TaxID=35708 RepID=A0A0A9AJI1_ARUDO
MQVCHAWPVDYMFVIDLQVYLNSIC